MGEVDAVREHMKGELGLLVGPVEPLGVAAYNRHYRVEVDGRRRHLVVYNLPGELPLAGLRFEHAMLRHLADSGYREAPELVVVDGESLFQVGNGYYALTEWIEGCHDQVDRTFSRAQTLDAVRALAELHRHTEGFDGRLDYFPEHVFVYPTADFLEAAQRLLPALETRVESSADFDGSARRAVRAFVPAARSFVARFDRDAYQRVRDADETRAVHGDFRRINLVLGGPRVVKVLDYNCCFNEIRLWDVAYAALSFGGHETVGPVDDWAAVARFIRAYHERSPLTQDEWALLPDFLTLTVLKLMTAATRSWWINNRAATFDALRLGRAVDVVERARRDDG